MDKLCSFYGKLNENVWKVIDTYSLEHPEVKVVHDERYPEVAVGSGWEGVGSKKVCPHDM